MTSSRNTTTTITRQAPIMAEPAPSAEGEAFAPVVGDHVWDMRPRFEGRAGTVTMIQVSHGRRVLLYVRPDDWDGERQAEWNATPDLVSLVHAGQHRAAASDDDEFVPIPAGERSSAS